MEKYYIPHDQRVEKEDMGAGKMRDLVMFNPRSRALKTCEWCKKDVPQKEMHIAWDWVVCGDCWRDLENDAHSDKKGRK